MIPCANCKTPTEAGKPCPNPDCEPPKSPCCGYRPWHEKARCPRCDPRPEEQLTRDELDEIHDAVERSFQSELGGAA